MTRFKIPRWPLTFFKWTLGITLTGAVLGALIFPLFGVFVDTGKTPLELTIQGIKTLGFFFGIWAPGTALVITVKKVYEAKRAGTLTEAEDVDNAS